MTLTAPLSAPHRFALIIDGLRRSVAGSHRRMAGPLILLICNRLGRIAARFAAVAARVGSGTVRAARSRGQRGPCDRSGAASRPVSSSAGRRLPGGFAWLLRLVPEAAVYGGQLQSLLADREMTALVSAAPEIGRLLRPLCRMLAVEPTPELRRNRVRRPAPAAGTATGQTTPPDEAAPPDASPRSTPTLPRAPRRAGSPRAKDLRWPPVGLPINRPPFPA